MAETSLVEVPSSVPSEQQSDKGTLINIVGLLFTTIVATSRHLAASRDRIHSGQSDFNLGPLCWIELLYT